MSGLLKRIVPLLVLLFILASGGWSINVRAKQPLPPNQSPRLERPADWVSADVLPVAPTGADQDAISSPRTQNIVDLSYPNRYNWGRTVFQSFQNGSWEILFHENGSADARSIVPLISHPAADFDPKFSPDAGKVIFVSNRSGNADIFQVNIDGTGLVQLTTDPAADSQPEWSPDGSQIVFVSDRSGLPSLYRMNSDGSGVRQITTPDSADYNPDWSPNGKEIAWVRVNSANSGQVMLMDASGSNPHAFTGVLSAPYRVRWSEKGDYLAFDADLDQDGWIDVGWIPTELMDTSITNICPDEPSIDCRLSSWEIGDNYLIFSKVTYTAGTNPLLVSSSQFYKSSMDSNSQKFPVVFSQRNSIHMNADTQVTDITSPETHLQPLPPYSRHSRVLLFWSGSDPGPAGVYDYKPYYMTRTFPYWNNLPQHKWGAPVFNESLRETGPHHAVVTVGNNDPEIGQALSYALQARDLAQNLESLPAIGKFFTTLYETLSVGLVTDNRGQPLSNVSIITSPPALNDGAAVTDDGGQFTTFHAQNVLENFSVEDGQAVPVQLDQDRNVRLVVSPVSSIPANGQFENGLDGWQTSGSAASDTFGHSGQTARLGVSCPKPCLVSKGAFVTVTYPLINMLVDSQNNTHFLVNGMDYWVYSSMGVWLHPDQPYGLQSNRYAKTARLDNVDSLHVLFRTDSGLMYIQKQKDSDWQNSEYVDYYSTPPSYPPEALMDIGQQGQVHVVYPENVFPYPDYFYKRRGTDGRWSQPIQVSTSTTAVAAAPDGGAYLFYSDQMQHISPTGKLEQPIWLEGCNVTAAQADNQARVHVLCFDPWMSTTYQVLDIQGNWTVQHHFNGAFDWDSSFSRDGSAVFYAKREYYDQNILLMIKQPDSSDFTYSEYDTGEWAIQKEELSIAASPQSGLHIATSGWSAFYSKSTLADTSEGSSLSQMITIPSNFVQPTLSFLYKLDSLAHLTNSGLVVTLTSQDTTTTDLFNSHTVGGWQHGWADLSPWAGQTVTLTFRYDQVAGEPVSSLLLDEINVGSWETVRIDGINPGNVHEWDSGQVMVTVNGSNFREGAVVRINGQDIAAVFISPNTLTFAIPGNLKLGSYRLRVINPGGTQSNATRITLGNPVILPYLSK